MENTTYADAGVNVKLGNEVSKILYEAAKLTWENRKGKLGEVIEIFPDFSGLRGIHVGELPKGTYINLNFDGVGTKIELAERMQKHDTVAHDLFAMVCDDAVVRGAEPVLVGSILDVNCLGKKDDSYIDFVRQLATGYINAAREAGVAVVNGEVAELGARVKGYGQFNYNWGAAVLWFAKKERLLTGYEIKEGDALVGLKEDGFRSNGLSLVRKVMKDCQCRRFGKIPVLSDIVSSVFSAIHGDGWHEKMYGDKSLGEMVLHQSRIYCSAVVDMFGSFDTEPKAKVHGVAHITGGGVPEKLSRVLKPSGLGADISDPFVPPEIMQYCQEAGSVSDREAYNTWNMGQGMIVITPEPEKAVEVAQKHNIEAKVIGLVRAKPGIHIRNYGYYQKEKYLLF